MKIWLIVIGCIALLGAFAASIIWFVFSLTEADRETGKAFVRAFSVGDATAVHALMHPALVKDFPESRIAEFALDYDSYVEVTFSSFSKSGEATNLNGVATTADGCKSNVQLDLLDLKVTSFNIEPLCPKE